MGDGMCGIGLVSWIDVGMIYGSNVISSASPLF
jgi:hypothetical protein